jgi:hypothetical protein
MMEQSRQFTECYVGTNCASTAWKEMEQNLRRNGIKLFTDKDFKNFDILQKRLYLVIMLDYFYLDLARFLGFSEEDMKLVYMVGVSDLFTYVNLNGDVILTAGTNFSGGFRTTGQNCAFNSILHRVVFYALTSYYFQQIGVKKPRYRDYCNLATFGDDSLEGISDKVALYYNFAKFKEYLLKYGILVTPARKSEGDYDFKKLEDCQFLKRAFVHDIVVDSEGGAHDVVLAPLEMTSVLKPLVFQVRSKSVTSEIQTIAAIMSVNRELWMHGRGAFDKYHGKLQAAKVILGDETLLETFDEISNMYLAGDYSTQET